MDTDLWNTVHRMITSPSSEQCKEADESVVKKEHPFRRYLRQQRNRQLHAERISAKATESDLKNNTANDSQVITKKNKLNNKYNSSKFTTDIKNNKQIWSEDAPMMEYEEYTLSGVNLKSSNPRCSSTMKNETNDSKTDPLLNYTNEYSNSAIPNIDSNIYVTEH